MVHTKNYWTSTGHLLPCKLTQLVKANWCRWKKQIFTEAEMVAQADDSAEGASKMADLIDLGHAEEAKIEEKQNAVIPTNERVDETKSTPATAPETGFSVEKEDSVPTSYADAVKVHNREVTIPEEHEPDSPSSAVEQTDTQQADIPNETEEQESADLLDKGKGKAQLDSPSTPAKSSHHTDEARDAVPSPRRPAATPTRNRPLSFPFPRSQSHTSDLASPHSGRSTPTRSPSHPNLSESVSNSSTGPGQSTPEEKGGKTRKRLSSIKGFVRRISDQGSGLVRSNSTGKSGSRSGGLASPSPDAGDGKKKLPLTRGNSGSGGQQ
jgi:ATP-binding cassette subfamily B (MDR/TAP) protein 6